MTGDDSPTDRGSRPGERYWQRGTTKRVIDAVASARWLWLIALIGVAVTLLEAAVL